MHIGKTISMGEIVPEAVASETPALDALAEIIRAAGPIRTARVSSAQARGAAKRYCYWDAVRYEIRLRADGRPSNIASERAASATRSEAKAERMLDALCEREDRIHLHSIGPLSESDAADILYRLRRAAECEAASA